jgi:hypothetical protein
MVISSSSLAELNATCVFDAYSAVYSSSEREPERTSIAQTMTIENGKTSSETMGLDGKVRATNSSNWTNLESTRELDSLSYFIGDTGEFLTIFHEVGEHKKSLKGNFRSALLNSGYFQSGVKYGQCSVN